MKDFIEKSGLTAAQFAKKYDIPYNTVRQWAEGIRSAPAWLVRLFENEQSYKPLIEEVCDGYFYEYNSGEDGKEREFRAFMPNEPSKSQIEWYEQHEKYFKEGTCKPKLTKKITCKYYVIKEEWAGGQE